MIRLWFVIGLLTCILSMSGLIVTTNTIHSTSQSISIIKQLPVIDEEIYFHMMMIQAGLVNNFDFLTQLNKKHQDTLTQATTLARDSLNKKTHESIKQMTTLAVTKEVQLEQFKSDIALIRNAKIYITNALRAISKSQTKNPAAVIQMSHELITFSERPSEDLAAMIRLHAAKVDVNNAPESVRESWSNGQRHLEHYLEKKISIMGNKLLTKNWLHINAYNKVLNAFETRYINSRYWQKIGFITLSIGVLLLTTLAILAIKRHLHSQVELRTLNQSLEARIKEAVADISVSRDMAIKANAAKTNFLANISHELRTPLNSIIGFSSRLERKLESEIDTRSLSAITNIRTNGLYLLNIFNDLIELSRTTEEEAVDMEISDANLNSICNSTASDISSYFLHKQVDINVVAAEDVTISSDRDRVKRIIHGVVNTAMHNTIQGSVNIHLSNTHSGCLIFIKDTGAYMNQEKIDVLLNPFERTGENTTINVAGIGLGLSLVTRMLKLLNGELSINSTDRGTEYKITLPHLYNIPEE